MLHPRASIVRRAVQPPILARGTKQLKMADLKFARRRRWALSA
jgi:hypothetical protein